MSDPAQGSNDGPRPLSYASPAQSRRRADAGMIAVVVLDVAAGAAAGVFLTPLAIHIYSCGASEKWCHIGAYVFGAPAALIIAILAALTMSRTVGSFMKDPAADASPRPPRLLTIAAWAGLLVAAGVVIALFVAVTHNS